MEPVAASASVAAFLPFAKGASASLSPSQAQSFGWGGGKGGQKDAGIPFPSPSSAEGGRHRVLSSESLDPFPRQRKGDGGRRRQHCFYFSFPAISRWEIRCLASSREKTRTQHTNKQWRRRPEKGRSGKLIRELLFRPRRPLGGTTEMAPPSLPFPFIDCYISWNHGGQGGGSRRG